MRFMHLGPIAAMLALPACGGNTLGSSSTHDAGDFGAADSSSLACPPNSDSCASSRDATTPDAGVIEHPTPPDAQNPLADADRVDSHSSGPGDASLHTVGATDGGPAIDDASVVSPPINLDSALPDASGSPTETFEIVANGGDETSLSCPTSHWEFNTLATSVVVRNTGGAPLAYISEPSGWILGVQYTPGVPTSEGGEQVGVLAPGATVTFTVTNPSNDTVALLGSSKPFSIYDGGFAAADEWTIAWPEGVSGSGGATTMNVAEIESVTGCSPVSRPE